MRSASCQTSLDVGVVAAGDRSPDIGLMALAGGPGDERPLGEDRPEHRDVVVLVAAREHVVVQDHVARMHIVAEKGDDLLAHRLEREGEHRDVLGLLQHVARLVIEPGDEVAGLVEDRRPGGAQERKPHLLGDRFETALDDRGKDRVDRGAHAPVSVRIRDPNSSTSIAKPGGTSAVVRAVSTIIGPAPRNPAGRASPS